jgi:hypothetical protein
MQIRCQLAARRGSWRTHRTHARSRHTPRRLLKAPRHRLLKAPRHVAPTPLSLVKPCPHVREERQLAAAQTYRPLVLAKVEA